MSVSSSRPLVLVANDDGVLAPGLRALRDAVAEFAEVWVVAPEIERSAASHAITLHRPVRLREIAQHTYALDGTPVDCVYVALHGVLPRRPDALLVGVNPGANLGSDVFYSGTVGAAREGALRGVPSLAVSLEKGTAFGAAAEIASRLIRVLLAAQNGANGPNGGNGKTAPLYNVNVPAEAWHGVRATSLGSRIYRDGVETRVDPRGRTYYWIGGPGAYTENIAGSDGEAINEGFVSVTPLGLDSTVSAGLPACEQLCKAIGQEPQ